MILQRPPLQLHNSSLQLPYPSTHPSPLDLLSHLPLDPQRTLINLLQLIQLRARRLAIRLRVHRVLVRFLGRDLELVARSGVLLRDVFDEGGCCRVRCVISGAGWEQRGGIPVAILAGEEAGGVGDLGGMECGEGAGGIGEGLAAEGGETSS